MEQNATPAALNDFVSLSLLNNAIGCSETYNLTPSNFTLHFRAIMSRKKKKRKRK